MTAPSTAVPLALLPVRLETRFSAGELLVLVVPDAIHVDTFEPELTDAEEADARAYWDQLWRSGRDDDADEAAWRGLAARYGPERAAWIARRMRPDPASRLSVPVPADIPLDPAPVFPSPVRRAASWTRPARPRLLPTRWHARVSYWSGLGPGQDPRGAPLLNSTVAGRTIKTDLAVGPDPRKPDPSAAGTPPRGTFPAWLASFAEAEAVGMGMRVPLSGELSDHVHRLVVWGVDETSTPVEGSQKMSDLLEAHYYSDGLSYLAGGTPTNNTGAVRSGHTRDDPAYAARFRVRDTDPTGASVVPDCNAVRLAGALSVPHADVDHVARAPALAEGAGELVEQRSRAMQALLWGATGGYWFSQMLAAVTGEESRRLDRRNIIAANAFLRFLERAQGAVADYAAAERDVLGVDGSDPNFERFRTGWLEHLARLIHERRSGTWRGDLSAEDWKHAWEQFLEDVSGRAHGHWQARGAPVGDQLSDWLGAEHDLLRDLTRSYAYSRWQDRVANGGQFWGRAVQDWKAGENAARYTPATVAAAAEHVIAHLRPGGPLPALRIGTQPYGVLPVLASSRWQPVPGEEGHAPFVVVLQALRDAVWLPAAARLSRLGADVTLPVAKAQEALVEILATAPVSSLVFARQHLGRDYLANLWRFARLGLDPRWEWTVSEASSGVRFAAGVAWRPRLAGLVAGDYAAPVTLPPVTGVQPAATYLAGLAAADLSWVALRGAATAGGDPAKTPLLYVMARHSLLREYADAAVLLRQRLGRLGDWEHVDVELVDARVDRLTATPWRQLAETFDLSVLGGGTPVTITEIGAHLGGDKGVAPAAGVARFRAAAAALAPVPPAQLELTLQETLDGWSHRLDAWFTSYASRRLTTIRKAQPEGLAVGGYGFVEHLSRRNAPLSDGFVHAPSLNQAVTAGVLRSGYTSHSGGGRNPFAINLSSSRVRTARWLLEGVRNGQPLASLGGYLFERAIHDAQADELLDDFRAWAPSHRTVVAAGTGAAAEVGVPSLVVDGLVLRTLWNAGDARIVGALDALGVAGTAKRTGVERALNALDQALDATADLLLAESVHHATSGNPTRAAATLDAVARGDGMVPDPTFVATPRTALSVTSRVALVASTAAPAAGTWPGALRPRVVAAGPALERIAAAMLPEPESVRCAVLLEAPGRQEVVTVRLSECDLAALDCVLDASPADPRQGAPAAIELAVRDRAAARLRATAQDQLVVDWARMPHWATADRSVWDLVASARLARAALRQGRPLVIGDLVEPERRSEQTPTADPGLPPRADAVVAALRAAAAGLADAATLAGGLRAAVSLGVPGAAAALLPGSAEGEAEAVAREVGRRLAEVDAVIAEADAAASATAAGASGASGVSAPLDPDLPYVRRIAAVLGEEPSVTRPLKPADVAAFEAAVTAGTARLGGSTAQVRHWLQRLSRVRPALLALRHAEVGTLALGGTALVPRVLQLPSVVNEPWVGQRAAISGPRLNVVLLATGVTSSGALPVDFAGVVIDEWSEQVPSDTQQTGVAFSVDTPAAQAPQSILLAIPPGTSPTWDDELVFETVLEALALAKVRAVDLEAVDDVGQLLPALYLAHNTGDATVSSEVLP